MEKFQILNDIKKHYAFKRDTDFATFLGISPQVLYNWKARNTFDTELVYSKCFDINSEWLLTGKGAMLKNGARSSRTLQSKNILYSSTDTSDGLISDVYKIMEFENEQFVIPTFKDADYLVQVKGDSMYPKYNSGDIVACKKLDMNDFFFQWDKVYVLETSQGTLTKRVKKGSSAEKITLISDNESYDSFELIISKILAVALVIGVIRVE
jgi:phage repressor protein C with HTH and peptisase S24 domain